MRPPELSLGQWMRHDLYFVLQHVLGYDRMQARFGLGKYRLENEVLRQLPAALEGRSRSVQEIPHDISIKDFESLSAAPLVFRGAAKDWPCCRNWNLDFFREKYGTTQIILNDNVGLIEEGKPQSFGKMTLADYIDAIRRGESLYLKFARDIIEDNPSLKDDLDLGWLRSKRLRWSFHNREEILMFMSRAGTLTPMHAGVSGNLFIQVAGQKTWTMYDASDRFYLDARTERTFYYFTKFDPRNIDGDAFPLSKFATRSQITLEAGDVLWVPPFVWHHVYNPTDSIGVTYRVMSLSAAFRASFLLMTLIFFATRPNPLYHWYMSTFHKKTAIFQDKFDNL